MPDAGNRWSAKLLCAQLAAAFTAGFLSLAWQLTALRIGIQEIGGNLSTSAAILSMSLMGLAVGSWFFGTVADNGKYRQRLAAVLLLAVAVSAILFCLVSRSAATWVARVLADSSQENLGAGWGPLVYSLLFVFPVHAIIGGIVPALVAQSTKSSFRVRTIMARLYAAETMGAATGALLTVFLLIPTIGIQATLLAGGASTLLISLLVFRAGSHSHEIHNESDTVADTSNEATLSEAIDVDLTSDSPPSWQRLVLATAVLLSSFASLGVELIWQRYFVFVFGSDSRSYAVVVAVMLIGVSLGSALAGWTWIRDRTLSVYWLSLIAIGGCISLSFLLLGMSMRAEAIQSFLQWILVSPFLARLLLAAGVVFLPAMVMGFALPLASELWTAQSRPARSAGSTNSVGSVDSVVDSVDSVGKSIGQFYGLVAIGNVIGIFCCARFLIPQIGLQPTALLLAMLPLTGGLLMAAFYRPVSQSRNQSPNGLGGWGKTLAALATFASISLLLIGLRNPARAGLIIPDGWNEVLYFEDSVQTIAVIESQEQKGDMKLLIDGVSIGENEGGVDEKQQMLAHLPALLKPNANPLRVYTIGLGTGILASELAEQDSVESVVAVELSEGVVQAVNYFSDSNQNLTTNPKVEIINDDGIRFLRQTDLEFDAIVSDGKSRPGATSNVSFFSREYYALCNRKLSDDGLFVQWVSIKCAENELKTILNTFTNVFPFGHIGIAAPGSIYLVGSKTPLELDPTNIDAHLSGSAAASLRKYGWGSADDILSMYWLDQTVLDAHLSGTAAINTFDTPELESFAWDSFRYSVQQLKPELSTLRGLIQSDADSSFNGQSIATIKTEPGAESLAKARAVIDDILEANLTTHTAEAGWLDAAAKHWKQAIVSLPNLNRQNEIGGYYRELAQLAASKNDLTGEYSALLNLVELNSDNPMDRMRVAKILESQGAFGQAVQYYFSAVSQAENKAPFRAAFAECLMLMGKYNQAYQQLVTAKAEVDGSDLSLQKRTAFLIQTCEFLSSGDPSLLQTLQQTGSEDPELSDLLQKFQIEQ